VGNWRERIPRRRRAGKAVAPLVCPACTAIASDALRARARAGGVTALQCDRAGCGKRSPLAHWRIQGRRLLKGRHKLDAEGRGSAESGRPAPPPAPRPAEARAEAFLAAWIDNNPPLASDDPAAETNRLLAKLITDAVQAQIPGDEILEASGGDFVRFIDVRVRRRAAFSEP
jgi:hypothetical protein